MPTPKLFFYSATPFLPGTKVTPMDFAIGTGDPDYDLLNKTGVELADLVQVEATQYFRSNGYSLTANTITFDTSPPINSRILFPGNHGLIFRVYDQDDVPGEATPRVAKAQWWLADNEDIEQLEYIASSGLSGIEVSVYDFMPDVGAQTSWFQFAPALGDGSEGTYLAAGAPLVLNPITAKSFLDGTFTAPQTVLTVEDGSIFEIGEYIKINPSGGNVETVSITNITGNDLTISGIDLNHSNAEPVFAMGRKGWLKVTIPLNAVDNIASVLADISLRRRFDYEQRF